MHPVRHASRNRWVVAGICALLAAVPTAASEIELVPASEGGYAPDAPLEFTLRDVPDDLAYRLNLTLDGVDVTRFIQRDGDVARLVLPHPIESGTRELRLVEVTDDGEIIEMGFWQAEVQPGAWLQEAEFRADLSGEVHRRFADEDLIDPPQRTTTMGAARIEGQMAGNDWDAQLHLPILYRRDRLTQSGQPWDLADGWLRARRGRFRTEIGHQTPGPSSFALEGFHRRGVSLAVDVPEIKSQVSAFSLRGDPISGFEEGIGLSDRDRRVNGVTFTSRPLETEGSTVALAGTYVRGRNQSGGSGVSETFSSTMSGTAWSAVADVETWQRRFRVRGEYARSRIDRFVDGPGSSERDDAYSIFGSLYPFQDLTLGDAPIDFGITASLEEVGAKFGSPANLFIQNDYRREQFGGELGWRGFSGRAQYTRTRYNAEGREEDPAFRNDSFETMASYQVNVDPSGFLARTLGAPFVEVLWSRNRLKPISTPDPTGALDDSFGFFMPTYADEHQRQGSLRIGAIHQRYDWSLSHTIGRIEDRTRLQPDTRTDLSSLDIGWQPTGSTRLNFSIQRDRYRLEDKGVGTTTWTANLGLYQDIIPQRLVMNANASFSQLHGSTSFADEADGFGVFAIPKLDERMLTFYGALTWTAIQPRPNRPGVTFTLDGVWERREDDVVHSNTRDTFQTFLKVRVDWPLHWRKGV